MQSLGFDKATAYHNIIVKLDLKGYNYTKHYSLKTLNAVTPYYTKSKSFIAGITSGDTAAVLSYLKPDVISPADMLQVYLTDDDLQVKYGNYSDIKIVGFEETRTKITNRQVMAIRAVVCRQSIPSEVYNLTFDMADQKIVGLGWDILKRADEANSTTE
ncbi:MAG: hypothetical protein M0D57_03390 [Sphingobacteriales bacterium JAD_PAG50586_3]|nr:MAG: hypothetical protein M0D57_03390 [Sphingobacteriales bacterium JAD_PAG50586_3]